jgi:hypothetical protein
VSGRTETVADPPPAVVVTTGLDEGVVTETVATGVVALTVVAGTDGATLGTVVDTAGTVVGTVVGTVGTTVDTVDTTVDTVDTTVDTVARSEWSRAAEARGCRLTVRARCAPVAPERAWGTEVPSSNRGAPIVAGERRASRASLAGSGSRLGGLPEALVHDSGLIFE